MKKVIFTLAFSAMTLFGMAQTPVWTLDFEGGAYPSGVTAVDGATSTSGDALATVETTLDKQNGSQSLQIANSGYLQILNVNPTQFSISFWTRWVDTGAGVGDETDDGVIGYAGFLDFVGDVSGTPTAFVFVDATNNNKLRVNKGTGADAAFDDGSGATDGSNRIWCHVTVTSDASNAYLYVNGQKIGEKAHQTNFASMTDPKLILGAKIDDAATITPKVKNKDDRYMGLCGYIDDVKLFSETLTAEQVAGLSTSIYGDIELGNEVNAYAVNNAIQVETSLIGSKKVTVYNLSGSPVYSTVENANTFATDELSKGIYIVSIEADGKSARVKVAVQ